MDATKHSSTLKAALVSVPLLFCLASTTSAEEIYRWVDENGRVHFGDRPPQNVQAEDISDSAKIHNVDESNKERQKLNQVFAPETPEEKYRRDVQAQQESRLRQQQCQQAQRQLSVFQRRFVLLDDEGNAINVSESERKAMVEKLQAQVQQLCY